MYKVWLIICIICALFAWSSFGRNEIGCGFYIIISFISYLFYSVSKPKTNKEDETII